MIRAAALPKTPFVCVQQFNKINSHGFFDTKETERVTTVTMTMTTGLKQHIKEIKVQAKRIGVYNKSLGELSGTIKDGDRERRTGQREKETDK